MWINPQIDGFANRCVVEFELQVIDGYAAVIINNAVHAQAKDVFNGLIGWRNNKLSEDRFFFFESSLKTEVRNFFGGGMNPFVIVLMNFAE